MMYTIGMVNIDPVEPGRMDLNLFLVFEAIHAEGNITRAAERLSLTQPSVSNALARLRQMLDDPLFVRTSTGMQPTALAESIAPRVHEALHLLRLASRPQKGFDPAASRRVFRLSLVEPYDAFLTAKLLAAVARQAPHAELHFTRTRRADLPRALESGAVEVAVDIRLRDTTDLRATLISRENWVCAFRQGHPLAGRAMTLEDYLALKHLSVSSRPGGDGPVDIALRRIGCKRAFALRSQQYAAVAAILDGSDLAMTAVESWARGMGLAVSPLPVDVPPFELMLYRHRHSDADPAATWMYDTLNAVCRAHLAAGQDD